MDGFMLPMMVAALAPKEQRGRLVEAMVPGLLPVAASQRAAVAAVAADVQVRSEDQRQAQTATESIRAAQILVTKPEGARTLSDQDLAGLPTLAPVLNRNSVGQALSAQLKGVGLAIDQMTQGQGQNLASDAVSLISTIQAGNKLSQSDLEATVLGAIILANPNLAGGITFTTTTTTTSKAPASSTAAAGAGAGGAGAGGAGAGGPGAGGAAPRSRGKPKG